MNNANLEKETESVLEKENFSQTWNTLIENASKMSNSELQNEIDNRIDEITFGLLEEKDEKRKKVEAMVFANIKLRRG